MLGSVYRGIGSPANRLIRVSVHNCRGSTCIALSFNKVMYTHIQHTSLTYRYIHALTCSMHRACECTQIHTNIIETFQRIRTVRTFSFVLPLKDHYVRTYVRACVGIRLYGTQKHLQLVHLPSTVLYFSTN